MNHIARQAQRIAMLTAEVEALRNGLYDLNNYASSAKFMAEDPLQRYMNVADVQTRVHEALAAGTMAAAAALEGQTA